MPKIVDREKQKAEILAAAFPLFARKGYGVVGMRQCAKELGVSTGTLYHYFDSKEILFEQMFLRKSQVLVQLLISSIPEDGSRDERIDALLGFMKANLRELQWMLAMAFDFRRAGSEASELLNQSFLFFRMSLEQMLGITDVEIADQLLVLVFGVISRETLLRDSLVLEAYREELNRILP